MTPLEKALARLKALLGELTTLEAKDVLTADDLKAITAKQDEVLAAEAEIETLKKSEQIRARQTVPAGGPVPGADRNVERDDNQPRIPAAVERKVEPFQRASLIAAATLKAKVNGVAALKILADEGFVQFAKELETEMRRRAVDTTATSVLIPEAFSNQIIEMLRPETTFFQGNPKRIQFTSGRFKAPRGATGASASYVGEGVKKPVTEPTFDSIDMASKKLAAIVLITEEARNWSVADIDAYIRDDLRQAMSQAIDLNAYFGTGAGDSPTGILNQGVPTFDAADFFASATAPTLHELDVMASRMILSLTLANIGVSKASWFWLMNYRTLEYLKSVRVGTGDVQGVYAYPELNSDNPVWKGFKVLVTNQVPINGGNTADETSISLIDFRHVLYGEEGGLQVKTSTEATVDVNGTLVHLWQQNMYGILTEHRHDFGLRHLEAVAYMHHIRWGALEGVESP